MSYRPDELRAFMQYYDVVMGDNKGMFLHVSEDHYLNYIILLLGKKTNDMYFMVLKYFEYDIQCRHTIF